MKNCFTSEQAVRIYQVVLALLVRLNVSDKQQLIFTIKKSSDKFYAKINLNRTTIK
ncbi:Uncharacterized protein dnm_068020 [Desulfonema magnum]|uniref:Uncharacterized protein n=1 Tax=Desulfonema magnum TaxID=45655 RepID=A0A975BSB8_9BACT|nr:Uncharacterized protein dnm_068020 [Desulfonema magnum]